MTLTQTKKVVTLTVTPTAKTWNSDDTTPAEFTVTANGEWSVTSSKNLDWADVVKGDGIITVTPKDANTSQAARKATLTVTHSGDNTKTVSINLTQKKAGGTEKEYNKLNTATTKIATSNSYSSVTNKDCANNLTEYGSYPSTAKWSINLGAAQTSEPAGLWLGSNSNNKSKMTLGNGKISGASEIATALDVKTTDTYYAALVCHTDFANITKVTVANSGTNNTGKPAKITLLMSTDEGKSYSKVAQQTFTASQINTFTISVPSASARFAIVFNATEYFAVKVPVVTFHTTD